MYVTHMCGCFRCRVAHSRSVQTARTGGRTAEERYVDATGTRRRIEALSAAGFPHTAVAAQLAVSKESVGYFRTARRVHVATARRIAAVYDELTAQPTPAGWSADRTRREAAARGWPPPIAWDDDIDDPEARPMAEDHSADLDEVAITEAMAGRLVRLTKSERAEAVRRLTGQGLSARDIADRLHITGRTVTRRRSAA